MPYFLVKEVTILLHYLINVIETLFSVALQNSKKNESKTADYIFRNGAKKFKLEVLKKNGQSAEKNSEIAAQFGISMLYNFKEL